MYLIQYNCAKSRIKHGPAVRFDEVTACSLGSKPFFVLCSYRNFLIRAHLGALLVENRLLTQNVSLVYSYTISIPLVVSIIEANMVGCS